MGLLDSGNKHRRAEMRLVGRAIRGGWDIPEEILRAMPAEVIRIAIEKKADGTYRYPIRERLRAIDLVRSMLRDNREADSAGLSGDAEGVLPEDLIRAMNEATVPDAEDDGS